MTYTNNYMLNSSDYTKILIIQNIINYIDYTNCLYKFKSLEFDTLVEHKYFTNVTIDKNIYWNNIKFYKNKLIKLNSFLYDFKKEFIIQANIFDSIDDDCRLYISSFL